MSGLAHDSPEDELGRNVGVDDTDDESRHDDESE